MANSHSAPWSAAHSMFVPLGIFNYLDYFKYLYLYLYLSLVDKTLIENIKEKKLSEIVVEDLPN